MATLYHSITPFSRRELNTFADVEAAHDAIYDLAEQSATEVVCCQADEEFPGCIDAFFLNGDIVSVELEGAR